MKSSNTGFSIRGKMGMSFDSMAKSSGDKFMKKKGGEKENKSTAFLKKKKMVYTYLKA